MAQQATDQTLPTDGKVDGAAYRNSYFSFNYFIPEQWVARGTSSKMSGAANSYLLLTLKKKSGDTLSSVTVSATELSQKYNGDLMRYLDERYRLHRQGALSATTINGIRAGRNKSVDSEPESLEIGKRQFFRVETEWSGVTRVAIATSEKGYALVFELIVPTQYAPEATTVFMDSMHALDFTVPVSVVKK